MSACYASIKTLSFLGMDVLEVAVEVHISSGLPGFSIVGLPDKTISESRDRIKAAFSSLLINFPNKKITVNMSPSNLPKEGNHYDLPIAIGILVATGVLAKDLFKDCMVLGELSLDGSIRPAKGILIAAIYSNSKDYKLVTAADSMSDISISGNNNVFLYKNLLEIISSKLTTSGYNIDSYIYQASENKYKELNMKDIKGQVFAKRALEIAAVFRLNILMIGSPGIGKSMLAKRMISILPDLSVEEKLETSIVYSLCDNIQYDFSIPYRDPHHSCSSVALLGGGIKAHPGEISLSNNGILFLDEFAEFSKCIEGLRECMENKEITLSRANYHIRYPAKCQVIAAMNPCKCGYCGTCKQCSKAPLCSQEYIKKISGPLLERFNIVLFMVHENMDEVKDIIGSSSEDIKERIINARSLYNKYYKKHINELNLDEILIKEDAKDFLEKYTRKNVLSHRIYENFLKIGISIALLDGCYEIGKKHITEGILYKKI